jgi:hypothetical protein
VQYFVRRLITENIARLLPGVEKVGKLSAISWKLQNIRILR